MNQTINGQALQRSGLAWLLCTVLCVSAFAEEDSRYSEVPARYPETSQPALLEPVSWQGPVPPVTSETYETLPVMPESVFPATPMPAESVSGTYPSDQLPPHFHGCGCGSCNPNYNPGCYGGCKGGSSGYNSGGCNSGGCNTGGAGGGCGCNGSNCVSGCGGGTRFGTTEPGEDPYLGGSPCDWAWGCGGSPYRNGPGWCDDWKVGPVWDVAVDGMVLTREHTNLAALQAASAFALNGDPLSAPDQLPPEVTEQFSHGPGGRLSLIGKLPRCAGYRVHFGYEGIEEWNAEIVYPKFTPASDPTINGNIIVASPDSSEQRSVNYRSSLHSGEINFMRWCDPTCDPYLGVRYIRFEDEINDFINQEAPAPLAGPTPITVTTVDRLNLFELENNLIGFQAGLRKDIWRVGERFTFEGFANTGVYYNKIRRTNLMYTETRQRTNDDTDTSGNETRNDVAGVMNLDKTELSEISYVSEASLSASCRLNRCWGLRAGYQFLWIANLHLADDAYLGMNGEASDMLFHGWHAGVECRR